MKNKNTSSDLAKALRVVANDISANQLDKPLGDPLVDEASLFETKHTMAILARLLMIGDHVTKESLKSSFLQMASETGMTMTEISSAFGNLKKDVVKNSVSWGLLEKLIRVLGYDVADISITMVDRGTGDVRVLKLSDIDKYDNPNSFQPTLLVKNID